MRREIQRKAESHRRGYITHRVHMRRTVGPLGSASMFEQDRPASEIYTGQSLCAEHRSKSWELLTFLQGSLSNELEQRNVIIAHLGSDSARLHYVEII